MLAVNEMSLLWEEVSQQGSVMGVHKWGDARERIQGVIVSGGVTLTGCAALRDPECDRVALHV